MKEAFNRTYNTGRHKVNSFVDKRIGEHDPNMSLEDKMMKRFVMERKVKRAFTY